MGALFSKPKIPAPQPTPPAPTVDDAQMRVDDSRRKRSRRGRAATRVVQEEGVVQTAARALTGN